MFSDSFGVLTVHFEMQGLLGYKGESGSPGEKGEEVRVMGGEGSN